MMGGRRPSAGSSDAIRKKGAVVVVVVVVVDLLSLAFGVRVRPSGTAGENCEKQGREREREKG
jgi:mRNA-degrading endonuclease toxin of MazEF toxin-antitoxin module